MSDTLTKIGQAAYQAQSDASRMNNQPEVEPKEDGTKEETKKDEPVEGEVVN